MKEARQKEFLSVVINNETTGEPVKTTVTNGIACVYVDVEGQHHCSFLGGIDSVGAIGLVYGLRKLADEIEKDIKAEVRPGLVEEVLALFETEAGLKEERDLK